MLPIVNEKQSIHIYFKKPCVCLRGRRNKKTFLHLRRLQAQRKHTNLYYLKYSREFLECAVHLIFFERDAPEHIVIIGHKKFYLATLEAPYKYNILYPLVFPLLQGIDILT